MNASTKWKLAALAIGLGMFGTKPAHAVDGAITITPVASVVLALAPTYYAFGSVDVNISTVAVSSITLRNNGSVNVTVEKAISVQSAPVGWTAGAAAGADTYALYVSTSLIQPQPAEFVASHLFGAESNSTNLTGLGGVQPVINTGTGADLWFKLAMPTSVSSQAAKTITVQFTGTAN